MCNDYGNYVDYADYLASFSQTRIPVKWQDAIPNLQPRDDIWPTDKAPVIRRLEAGTNDFTELRWSFPPAQPKRPPVINFRSEGRRFPVGRCLVPASSFYEFTGTKTPKTKWRFTKAGGGLVLLRRALASRARRRRGLHAADDRPGSRCGADPRSSDGHSRARRLVGLA
jgi:putative SOS response-associated peptidase YedK